MSKLVKIVRNIAIFPIFLYQKTLSFDHGPLKILYPYGYCRFHPTCSEYAKQSIIKKGIILGSILGIWRVLRCNPWSKGGVDQVK
ncbi:MAG: membrane protein insertion efficiency factor YidD [Patescibacteria group bacterium]